MTYDLIIVVKSETRHLIAMTENCINTCLADGADVNVIVVETGQYVYEYKKADYIILYTGPFIYNHALNLGLQKARGDVHILANNDIVFSPGWSKIGEQMKLNNFGSACALSCDNRHRALRRGEWIYEGYAIGVHVTGWCIFATREAIKTIGKLDESMEFWYSDNVYADQLIHHGIRHGLFCNVQVDHITSQTLRLLPVRMQRQYSQGQVHRYNAVKRSYAKGKGNQ